MAENRETETFALGLIIAAIVYFLFRGQLDKVLAGGGNGGGSRSPAGGGGGKGSGGGCGCGGGCGSASDTLPTNPGISVGNQSYNSGPAAFGAATVAAAAHPSFFTGTLIGS